MNPISLFGLALKRISPPANFPRYECAEHGSEYIACVQYGTGIEAANIEAHMFCGMCFAQDLGRVFPVKRAEVERPDPGDAREKAAPKIPLKGAA